MHLSSMSRGQEQHSSTLAGWDSWLDPGAWSHPRLSSDTWDAIDRAAQGGYWNAEVMYIRVEPWRGSQRLYHAVREPLQGREYG
jgi:hypothetical protein